MKATLVTKRSSFLGSRCRQCPRAVAVGDSVLVHPLPEADRARDRHFVVHTACMAALVEDAPVGRPPVDHKAQFYALRRQILATGDPFPSVG